MKNCLLHHNHNDENEERRGNEPAARPKKEFYSFPLFIVKIKIQRPAQRQSGGNQSGNDE